MTYRLSILDKALIPEGLTAPAALEQTVALAVLAEQLGFHRYWFAEHHGIAGLASSAPELLAAHVLARTSRIRVGTGGVMLQHYAPFKVAESFNLLASLSPGRVDLGVGKAPGGLPHATRALRPGQSSAAPQDFAEKLRDLDGFLTGRLPADHPYAGAIASPPADRARPPHPAGRQHRQRRTGRRAGLGLLLCRSLRWRSPPHGRRLRSLSRRHRAQPPARAGRFCRPQRGGSPPPDRPLSPVAPASPHRTDGQRPQSGGRSGIRPAGRCERLHHAGDRTQYPLRHWRAIARRAGRTEQHARHRGIRDRRPRGRPCRAPRLAGGTGPRDPLPRCLTRNPATRLILPPLPERKVRP
ncbi:MsnO8 family LLM class oxidoreductase [Novosphingobium sp.]|uniref:MsnO8 family LLM class oxidoreductase n=1 Tax=Novosphingobium sp. TaxID=1874826 RepID=UPI0031D51F8B